MAGADDTLAAVALLQKDVADMKGDYSEALDTIWMLLASMLVFFMGAGFSLREAGCVRFKNSQTILAKNLLVVTVGFLCWYVLGYGLALGVTENPSRFAGKANFFMDGFGDSKASFRVWLFHGAFCATVVYIVSGAMAERTQLKGFGFFTVVMTSIIYPCIVWWAWSGHGFLNYLEVTGFDLIGNGYCRDSGCTDPTSCLMHESWTTTGSCGTLEMCQRACEDDRSCIGFSWAASPDHDDPTGCEAKGEGRCLRYAGDQEITMTIAGRLEYECYKVQERESRSLVGPPLIDFAGSGVVHLAGGVGALVGAALVGPRVGRWTVDEFSGHSIPFCVLGTFFLWFGWYGFNPGSTASMKSADDAYTAGMVACNTTLAPCVAGLVVFALRAHVVAPKRLDVGGFCNGILAGLVAITAGCASMKSWESILVGLIAGFVYQGASMLLQKLGIDDVVDAVPVHGACGLWGLLACGFFGHPDVGGNGMFYGGNQITVQLFAGFMIILWVGSLSLAIFFPLRLFGMLRLPEDFQEEGADVVEHSPAKAYNNEEPPSAENTQEADNGQANQAAEVPVLVGVEEAPAAAEAAAEGEHQHHDFDVPMQGEEEGLDLCTRHVMAVEV